MDKAITDILCYIFRLIISENKSPKEVQFIFGTDEPIKGIVICGVEYVYDPEMYIWVQKETKGETDETN